MEEYGDSSGVSVNPYSHAVMLRQQYVQRQRGAANGWYTAILGHWASDQLSAEMEIACLREQYVTGRIEIDAFERGVERALRD